MPRHITGTTARPEGSTQVDLAPQFLKKGREGFAGLFTFLLQQAAEKGGFPAELIARLFGGREDGVREDGGREDGVREEGGREDGALPAEVATLPALPVLPTIPGLPGFLEGEGRGPNVAAAVAVPAITSLFASLFGGGGLLRGGAPELPTPVVGGEGNITPIFPDMNQQQLQLFLQLLQQLSTGGPAAALSGTGGPAAALGPNPLTADAVAPSDPLGLLLEQQKTAPSLTPEGAAPGGALVPQLPAGITGDKAPPTLPGGEPPPADFDPLAAIRSSLGFDPTGVVDPNQAPLNFQTLGTALSNGGGGGFPSTEEIVPGATDIGSTLPLDIGDVGIDPVEIDPGIDGEGNGGGGNGVDQTQADQLNSFLEQIQSGNQFQDLAQFFSLPTFEGPFTTPATDLQRQALGASSEFLGTDLGERNQVAQDALQELIRTGGEGAPGVDPLGQLTRETSADPTLNEFLKTGGGRFDLSPQFSALEAINKRRLDEQIARQREQFGVLGGRFGTDIARGRGELESRFLEAESGQRAEIAGQSFREQQQRRLASLGLASGRDIAREGLGVQARGQELDLQTLLQNVFAGQQTRRLQGLGLGEQQRQTDIAARGQRGREITEGFRLGEAERQIGDTAIQRQLAEFGRTQGALLPMLLQFFSQGVGEETLVLDEEG